MSDRPSYNPKDVQVNEWRGGPQAPVKVRMTHKPTGTQVEGECETPKGVFELKRDLWRALDRKVAEGSLLPNRRAGT